MERAKRRARATAAVLARAALAATTFVGCGSQEVADGAGGTGGGTGGSATGGTGTAGGTGGSGKGGSGGTGGDAAGGMSDAAGGGSDSGSCDNVRILAHGQQVPGDTTPFAVPSSQDHVCFYFKAPWNVPTQALRFTPVIDNSQVLTQYLLYATTTTHTDGSSASCFGVHSDGTLLTGWAPGAGEWIMPPDVGMELPHGPNAYLVLEIHYYNDGVPNLVDRSGVEVCATPNLRTNTATLSWLGTESILIDPNAQVTATGTCTPSYQAGPITILRSWPHMHKLGRGMRADILRAGGGTEVLLDVPNFDFAYQHSYETPAVLNPGDRIVTTCSYQNTTPSVVTFGPAAENEMCYNFVVAYPANALTSAGLMPRACLL